MDNNTNTKPKFNINKIKKVESPKAIKSEKPKDESKVEMIDFWGTVADQYDEFDKAAWNKGNGYSAPNSPIFTEKIEGLDTGLYMFAGEANMGKTAIAVNLLWDFCTNPDNKLFGLYFSLDDSSQEVIPRIIAMDQHIPISIAAKPKRYQNLIDQGDERAEYYADLMEKREAGIEHLKELASHFRIEDGRTITCA